MRCLHQVHEVRCLGNVDKTVGQLQDKLERLCPSNGLREALRTPGRSEGGVWGARGLSVSSNTE